MSYIKYALLLLLLLALPVAVLAQEGAEAVLSHPQAENFPRIRMFLDPRDSSGNFIYGLQESNISLLEDGSPVPLALFENIHPGAQFVSAINPGRSFVLRNSRGVSRYDMVIQALADWSARRAGSTIDDISLLVAEGTQVSHMSNPEQYAEALSRVDLEAGRDLVPDLDILARAIDIASDNPVRPGMGRAVIFITAPLEGSSGGPISDLVSRANQHDIQIDVWMVAADQSSPASAAEELSTLASQTGGVFTLFTGSETPPDLEATLDSLRQTYLLEYDSRARESGTHQVTAQIRTPFGELETPPQTYQINVLPPDPAFIAPVFEITRQPPEEADVGIDEQVPVQAYQPDQHSFEILVSFPDEMVRPLVRTTLYVDDLAVDENLEPPFDRLTWDFQDLDADSTYRVAVEAEDSLGLVGRSIDTMVQVSIAAPRANPWSAFYRNIPLLAGLFLAIILAVVILVLILRGRIRPRLLPRFRRPSRKVDPDQQPTSPDHQTHAGLIPKWIERLRTSQRTLSEADFVYLSLIASASETPDASPIVLSEQETTLGSDPDRAGLVIDDPAVDPVHARITKSADGSYQIQDQESIAGTWLNYSPVPEGGATIQHGDLIRIGRAEFRFNLSNPPAVRKPVITPITESTEPPENGDAR